MGAHLTTPVLLTAFNRPETTALVFEAIRAYRPAELFIALDGPRPDHPRDGDQCAEVRRAVSEVDWECDVRRLVRDTNHGCKRGMSTAIDWFFDHVDQGIVLEDDCVPAPGFFLFCEELLERYRTDERVCMISGTNVLGTWRPTPASYHFGLGTSGAYWGWATWRRAWHQADIELNTLQSPDRVAKARRTLGRKWWRHLEPRLQRVAAGEVSSWAYPWVFTCASHGGLAAIPAENLVTNIGFGQGATNTVVAASRVAGLDTGELDRPLRHPATVELDRGFRKRSFTREIEPTIRAQIAGSLPRPVEAYLRRLNHVLKT